MTRCLSSARAPSFPTPAFFAPSLANRILLLSLGFLLLETSGLWPCAFATAQMSSPLGLCRLNVDSHPCLSLFPWPAALGNGSGDAGSGAGRAEDGQGPASGYHQDKQAPSSFGEYTSLRWALPLFTNEFRHPSTGSGPLLICQDAQSLMQTGTSCCLDTGHKAKAASWDRKHVYLPLLAPPYVAQLLSITGKALLLDLHRRAVRRGEGAGERRLAPSFA